MAQQSETENILVSTEKDEPVDDQDQDGVTVLATAFTQDGCQPANRGGLGKPSPVVTWITILKDGEQLRVQALVDSGSESSYFSPDLLPMAVTKRPITFRLETLSTTAATKEKVSGLEAGFTVLRSSGETLRINLIRHDGLGRRDVQLKSKLLTCPRQFAAKHNLKKEGLTESCTEAEHEEQYTRPAAKLSIVLGLDLGHVAPKLIDTYSDEHGYMSIYYCPFDDKLIASGNRTFPLTGEDVDQVLAEQTSGCFSQTREGNNEQEETTMSIMGSTSLPPPEPDLPRAIVVADSEMEPPELTDSEESDDDDPEDEGAIQARVEEARRLLTTGVVSKGLHRRLEMFTAKPPQPKHRLRAGCQTCPKCPQCMELADGQNFYMRLQLDAFRGHLVRQPVTSSDEQDITQYRYHVRYIEDPNRMKIPKNYETCVRRHLSLRRAFDKLPIEVQEEFSRRLTEGLKKNYWEIVPAEEERQMRSSVLSEKQHPHWLPANFQLKEANSSASTKARLVLDPSESLNGTLLDPPNIEEKIATVLRRQQSLPIVFSSDIKEAFFRLRLRSESTNSLMFLMDFDANTQVLTAKAGPDTTLVTVRPLVCIMGVKQSPIFLALGRHDMVEEIKPRDPVLADHLKKVSYVDDCQSGLRASEVAACQLATGSTQMIQQASHPCHDTECCSEGPDDVGPSMIPDVPPDEVRATRHLLQGALGQELTHRLVLRAAHLEWTLRMAGMPSKGLKSNLEKVVCPVLLNEAVVVYTLMLAKKQGEPTVQTLLMIPPPVGFVSRKGPKQWYQPWTRAGPASPSSPSSSSPILRLAAAPAPNTGGGEEGDEGDTTLLGYRWNTQKDILTTDKSPTLNLHPASRGRRPSWSRIQEATDLLKIHSIKKLKHKHALSAAHACFDPLGTCPWVQAISKYMYRFLVLSSPGAAHYETELTDEFVQKHLYYAVDSILKAKKLLAQRRSWRLPVAVDYSKVVAELDCLCDGAWGVVSGSAAIVYLLQRYVWKEEKRTSIYLYSASVGLNPLSKVTHQVDSELQGMALAVSETGKALAGLADEGLEIQPRLTSDSQTALSLCCKAAVQLDLGAGLIINRVQELFGYKNLHYAPAACFETNVDLLTRYNPRLLDRIGPDFYAPAFLIPPIESRVTTPLATMTKVEKLPRLNAKQMMWASVATATGLPPNLLEVTSPAGDVGKGYSTTGRGALHREETCVQPCLVCGTAKPEDGHLQDNILLQAARDKLEARKETFKVKHKGKDEIKATAVKIKKRKYTLAAVGLGAFKQTRPRHVAKGSRSGLIDKRPATDDNPWRHLLSRRRGYKPAQRVLARIIELFRKKKKTKEADDIPAMDQALIMLFKGERANSYKAAETRRGNQTWRLVEDSDILFIQGRAIDPGPPDSPSLLMQEDHLVLGKKQQSSYMVPLLSPTSALGRAVCQQVHDQFCGESAASALARSSRYFYHTPSALSYFKTLSDECFKCRRLRMQRGTDVIAPMRNLGEAQLTEGHSLMVDVAGPWDCFLYPKQVGAAVTRRTRPKTKQWVLLGVDYFSHRVEVATLDSMTTDSLTSGLSELMMANGWHTRTISLDPGSSLLPAVHRTARHLQDEDEDEIEGAEGAEGDAALPDDEIQPKEAAALLDGLRHSGFKIRTPWSTSSWKQAKIESTIRVFKRTLKASLMPGSVPLTVTSLSRAVRLSANLLNLRPIVLLPSSAADPDELIAASPTSLRGPANCQWAPLGAGRDYSGQAAIIEKSLQAFRKHWVTHYARRLRATHKMAPDGPGWHEGDIVLVTDLASKSGRDHPYPRLAKIVGWLDEQKSQAVLRYQGGTVNRPVGKLSLLVPSSQKIPEKGLMFDALVQADQDVLEDNNTEFALDKAFNADADVDKPKQTESIIDQASDADADVDQPNQKMMAQEVAVQMADKPAMVATVPIQAPRRSQRERRPPTRFQ